MAAAALRVLAVDGGQSAIRVAASGGARAVEVDGLSRATGSDAGFAAAVAEAWRVAGSPAVDRAVLGMTTAPTRAAAALELGANVGDAIGATEVWVCDDAVTSHAAGLSGGWGVSIVAGTGVACLVLPATGEPRIIGGHGYLLGDEGGAFWIGREGLRAALRASEDRGPATTLTDAAVRRFGDATDIPVRVHDDPRPVNAIAQFATDVLSAAGDAVATSIVARAAAELRDLVAVTVGLAAADPGSGPVPVALGGRLLADPTPLRDVLDRLLEGDTTLVARTADASPLDGAMRLGSQATPGRYAPLVHVWRREPAW